MAFDKTNFGRASCHQNSNLPAEWVYTTTDTAATVDTAGYFNDMADFLNVGDLIKANIDTDGTPGYKEFFVSANDGTTVDVNDATARAGEGATDTD